MIIVKAPLRVSFVGGGMDRPEFYNLHGMGSVVSTTINKWFYVYINKPTLNRTFRVCYKNSVENVVNIEDIQHDIIKEALLKANVEEPIEVVTMSDIPGKGNGLGSSSALSVALWTGLCHLMGINQTPQEIAESAFEIERKYSCLGKQDQFASAIGGFKEYRFSPTKVDVTECEGLNGVWDMFQFFWIKPSLNTHEVLKSQNLSDLQHYEWQKLPPKFKTGVAEKDITKISEALKANWEFKRNSSSLITNPEIEILCESAEEQGALGYKILGSGGGGVFMTFSEKKIEFSGVTELEFKNIDTGVELYEN